MTVKIAKEFKIEFEERTIPSDADVEEVVAELTPALPEARLRACAASCKPKVRNVLLRLAENEEELPIIAMLFWMIIIGRHCTPRWCSLPAGLRWRGNRRRAMVDKIARGGGKSRDYLSANTRSIQS